jgi:hypothetical protein
MSGVAESDEGFSVCDGDLSGATKNWTRLTNCRVCHYFLSRAVICFPES